MKNVPIISIISIILGLLIIWQPSLAPYLVALYLIVHGALGLANKTK
jgi:uncharacterized membrane protein HdeD (DUF308 family)